MAVYQKISTIYPTTGLDINAAGDDDEGVAGSAYFLLSLWEMAEAMAEKEAQERRRRELEEALDELKYAEDSFSLLMAGRVKDALDAMRYSAYRNRPDGVEDPVEAAWARDYDDSWIDTRTPEEKAADRWREDDSTSYCDYAGLDAEDDAAWAAWIAEEESWQRNNDEEERVMRVLDARRSSSGTRRAARQKKVPTVHPNAVTASPRVRATAAKRVTKERRASRIAILANTAIELDARDIHVVETPDAPAEDDVEACTCPACAAGAEPYMCWGPAGHDDDSDGWYDDRSPEEKESARILQACAASDAWEAAEEERLEAIRLKRLLAEQEEYEAYGDPDDDPYPEEALALRRLDARNSRSRRVGKKNRVEKPSAAAVKRRDHAAAAKRDAKSRRADRVNIREAGAELAEQAECQCWACSDEWWVYHWHTLGWKHLGYEWCWCGACSAWPRCTYDATAESATWVPLTEEELSTSRAAIAAGSDACGDAWKPLTAEELQALRYEAEERDAIEADREFFEDD